MSLDPRRLLGLAFAAADLLIEIDPAGDVAMAVGASKAMFGSDSSALTGQNCAGLFHPVDQAVVASLIGGLAEGERRGPVVVRLNGDPARAASARAFRFPGGGDVSLALIPAPPPPQDVGDDGLHTPASFEIAARGLIEAARVTGAELELAMVEVAGMAAARAALTPEDAAALDAKVASELRLQSFEGVGAARLGDERYALVRARGLDPKDMARRLATAFAVQTTADLQVEAHTVALDANGDVARALRAMRNALQDFADEGLSDVAPASLAEAMNRSVRRTLARAGELGVAISQRRFQLAFQPVVDLKSATAHHHEVLVRFDAGESPFALIQMAEQFDLIEELDHAIVEQTVSRLKATKDKALRLAVNVSGRTITSEAFVHHVTDLVKASPEVRGRLIFEVTESSAIDDLQRANRHIQILRNQLGSLVCLDDFGAGSASLAYLQQLTLDIVKIDGRYVRDLAAGGRDAAMVRHIVQLCTELKVRTVAEMVETIDMPRPVSRELSRSCSWLAASRRRETYHRAAMFSRDAMIASPASRGL